MYQKFKETAQASKSLLLLSSEKITQVLQSLAKEIWKNKDHLLQENQKDLKLMKTEDPKFDRLKLTEKRLQDIMLSIEEIAKFPCPIDEIIEERKLKNNLFLQKIRVPLGVVGMIFEARPNVFFDCFVIAFKAKNGSVLKGSRDAYFSNSAIFNLIQKVLKKHHINEKIICFLPSTKEAVKEMFQAHGVIDVLIPRGSAKLINFVRQNSQLPVIETGAGIVHCFVDQSADIKKAANIIFNAKTSRPAVCNALECVLLHEKKLKNLPQLVKKLAEKKVIIFADKKSFAFIENFYPKNLLKTAQKENYQTEFLSLKLAIKTVNSLEKAIEHIDQYSSKHSEIIISEDQENIKKFKKVIDASAIFINTSSRFNDGGIFGLGAEIGISTQKLHARGPMGIKEITSYKWIVSGQGQVRN